MRIPKIFEDCRKRVGRHLTTGRKLKVDKNRQKSRKTEKTEKTEKTDKKEKTNISDAHYGIKSNSSPRTYITAQNAPGD